MSSAFKILSVRWELKVFISCKYLITFTRYFCAEKEQLASPHNTFNFISYLLPGLLKLLLDASFSCLIFRGWMPTCRTQEVLLLMSIWSCGLAALLLTFPVPVSVSDLWSNLWCLNSLWERLYVPGPHICHSTWDSCFLWPQSLICSFLCCWLAKLSLGGAPASSSMLRLPNVVFLSISALVRHHCCELWSLSINQGAKNLTCLI